MTAMRLGESLVYGVKMCLYWLAVVVAGGGGVALGSALAWPEVQSWRSNGAISTPELAGGAVLAFLGLFVLVSGLFGIVYKLLVDSVADGNAASGDSVAEVAESEMENHTTAPAEQATDKQTASQPTDDQTSRRPGTSESGATGGAIAEAAESDIEGKPTTGIEDETEQPVAQPGDEETVWEGDWEEKPAPAAGTDDSPAEQGSAESQPDDEESRSQPSGEQRQPSAEEIAFGSAPPETDDGQADAESTAPDTQDESTTTETAGDPSSDPLADRLSDDN